MRIEGYYKLTCITSSRLDFHIYSIIAITLRLIQGFFNGSYIICQLLWRLIIFTLTRNIKNLHFLKFLCRVLNCQQLNTFLQKLRRWPKQHTNVREEAKTSATKTDFTRFSRLTTCNSPLASY